MLAVGIVQAEGLIFAVFAEEVKIDFEAFPQDPQPADEMVMYDQYLATHFVTFVIDRDGNVNTIEDQIKEALLEDRGGQLENPAEEGKDKGFRYDVGFQQHKQDPDNPEYFEYMDIEHPAYRTPELGFENFLLKLNTDVPTNVNLLIEFYKPALEVSGRIWDIDATMIEDPTTGESVIEREQWRIIAYTKDSDGRYEEIGLKTSPAGLHPFLEPESEGYPNLDGKPFTWEFASSEFDGNPEIYAVMMSFEGTRLTDVGLAFDQLRVLFKDSEPPVNPPVEPPINPPVPPTVPEPGTFVLLGLGILGLRFVLKKNRRK